MHDPELTAVTLRPMYILCLDFVGVSLDKLPFDKFTRQNMSRPVAGFWEGWGNEMERRGRTGNKDGWVGRERRKGREGNRERKEAMRDLSILSSRSTDPDSALIQVGSDTKYMTLHTRRSTRSQSTVTGAQTSSGGGVHGRDGTKQLVSRGMGPPFHGV